MQIWEVGLDCVNNIEWKLIGNNWPKLAILGKEGPVVHGGGGWIMMMNIEKKNGTE